MNQTFPPPLYYNSCRYNKFDNFVLSNRCPFCFRFFDSQSKRYNKFAKLFFIMPNLVGV